jgi:hypothetical protein
MFSSISETVGRGRYKTENHITNYSFPKPPSFWQYWCVMKTCINFFNKSGDMPSVFTFIMKNIVYRWIYVNRSHIILVQISILLTHICLFSCRNIVNSILSRLQTWGRIETLQILAHAKGGPRFPCLRTQEP